MFSSPTIKAFHTFYCLSLLFPLHRHIQISISSWSIPVAFLFFLFLVACCSSAFNTNCSFSITLTFFSSYIQASSFLHDSYTKTHYMRYFLHQYISNHVLCLLIKCYLTLWIYLDWSNLTFIWPNDDLNNWKYFLLWIKSICQ